METPAMATLDQCRVCGVVRPHHDDDGGSGGGGNGGSTGEGG